MFSGYPKGTVEIRNFKAKAGEWDKGELLLQPGEYYLRAYLRTDDADPVPYDFEGMRLVAGEPVGVFGVASGAEKVTIAPTGTIDPVHIMLDKLFEKPGSGPDTKARIRLDLSVAPDYHAAIALQRQVVVGLYASDDFDADPVTTFGVASELLKVEGQVGHADIVSPSLEPGRYALRVFLDSDGDGMVDVGELTGVYQLANAPAMIDVKTNYTAPVTLSLAPAP